MLKVVREKDNFQLSSAPVSAGNGNNGDMAKYQKLVDKRIFIFHMRVFFYFLVVYINSINIP